MEHEPEGIEATRNTWEREDTAEPGILACC